MEWVIALTAVGGVAVGLLIGLYITQQATKAAYLRGHGDGLVQGQAEGITQEAAQHKVDLERLQKQHEANVRRLNAARKDLEHELSKVQEAFSQSQKELGKCSQAGHRDRWLLQKCQAELEELTNKWNYAQRLAAEGVPVKDAVRKAAAGEASPRIADL